MALPERLKQFRPSWMPPKQDGRRSYTPAQRERQRFYSSAAWKRARAAHLAAFPLCATCEKASRVTAGVIVDHLVEVEIDPDRALDPTNFQTQCGPCHSARTRRREGERRRGE
jgi:5-methylcytosine-specific restriction enzyme A